MFACTDRTVMVQDLYFLTKMYVALKYLSFEGIHTFGDWFIEILNEH